MSCVAEYITAGGRSPQPRLGPYKFRRAGKGLARTTYYQPAIRIIREYHRAGNDRAMLDREVLKLHAREHTAERKGQRRKLRLNGEAIEAYLKLYGNRRFEIVPNHRLAYEVGPVTVTAQPDLWVREGDTQVLLKIGMAKHTGSYVDMLLSLLRKAAVKARHKIRAKNIVYLDVATGRELICSGALTRFNGTFASAARNIARIWPSLNEPQTGNRARRNDP